VHNHQYVQRFAERLSNRWSDPESIILCKALYTRITVTLHHPARCCVLANAGGLVLRFVASPLLILAVSYAFGLRGIALKSAVVQGALPQAIASFAVCAEPKSAQKDWNFASNFSQVQNDKCTV
jgi:hypothetical protein